MTMKYKIFCVRDRASDAFGIPMFLASRGQAIRSFTDEVNRKAENNQLYLHPEDFDLYALGTYNDDGGVFEAHTPEMICVGKDIAVREDRDVVVPFRSN